MRRFLLGCALAALVTAGAPGRDQPIEPRLGEPVRLDEGEIEAQSIHLTATSRNRVAVAWVIGGGSVPGIYLRQRDGDLGIWQPIQRIEGRIGDRARDLALAYDEAGGLHLVWTGLVNGQRRLFHARADAPDLAPANPAPLSANPADADAEFPLLVLAPGMGMTAIWQENGPLSSVIRAMVIDGADGPSDLGLVSGGEDWALAPQLISTEPLRLAWYQADQIGGRMAVSQWDPEADRWMTASIAAEPDRLARDGFVALLHGSDRMAAAWREGGLEGEPKIAVALDDAATTAVADRIEPTLVELPPGEHASPALSGDPDGRLTLGWQNFANGARQVCLRSLGVDDGTTTASLVVSAPEQRFAGLGDHVSIGDWSIVAWTDISRDGGRGGVYVREIDWRPLAVEFSPNEIP